MGLQRGQQLCGVGAVGPPPARPVSPPQRPHQEPRSPGQGGVLHPLRRPQPRCQCQALGPGCCPWAATHGGICPCQAGPGRWGQGEEVHLTPVPSNQPHLVRT